MIVAGRQSSSVLIAAGGGGFFLRALSFECFPRAIALDIHLEDGGVVDEAIDGGKCHDLVWEDAVPFGEWLIGGDEDGASFVAGGDKLEDDAGLGLVLGDVCEVVEYEPLGRCEGGGVPPDALCQR